MRLPAQVRTHLVNYTDNQAHEYGGGSFVSVRKADGGEEDDELLALPGSSSSTWALSWCDDISFELIFHSTGLVTGAFE